MRILHLCSKEYWNHKMSRVRFHSIDAIGRHPDVTLTMSGPGWDGFSDCKRAQDKHKPDLVVWYKPLAMPGFDRVTAPRCLRYNEMWAIEHTAEEIEKSGSGLIICHHANDIPNYRHMKKQRFFHNPHCAEKTIFKNYGQKKDIDVMLTGTLSTWSSTYPFRNRLHRIMNEQLIPAGLICHVQKHPGYSIKNVGSQVATYARLLNRAKIVLTCSSRYKYALAKYSEVPLCRAVLGADIPEENQDWYKSWILHVDPCMTDKEIVEQIRGCNVPTLRAAGLRENLASRTQEHYADRFVQIAKEFLG